MDELPDHIIQSVLRLATIGDLVIAENDLNAKGCDIDSNIIWMDKLWKVLSNTRANHTLDYNQSNDHSAASFAKRVCLEFYVSQFLMKIGRDSLTNKATLPRILESHGSLLAKLDLRLEYGSQSIDTGYWKDVLGSCKKLKTLTINCTHFNQSLASLLRATSQAFEKIEIRVIILVPGYDPTILNDINSFCHIPALAGPKLHPQYEKTRYLRLQTENRFNIQGISSLAEYLDKPSKPETIEDVYLPQKTLPISLTFKNHARQKPIQSLKLMSTDLFIPHIQILSFKDIELGLLGANQLADIINSSSNSFSLTHVDISNTKVTAQGLTSILFAMSSSKSLQSRLKSLGISRVLADDDSFQAEAVKQLATSLTTLKCLQELDVSWNKIQSVGMRVLTDALFKSSVNKLDLSGMSVTTCISSLTRWMQSQPIELKLSACSLMPRSFLIFLGGFQNVKSLDLSNNTMDANVVKQLTKLLPLCGIERLDISCTKVPISAEFLKGLGMAKQLIAVYLDSNTLKDSFMTSLGHQLAKGNLWNVQMWSLKDNEITAKGVKQLKMLAQQGNKKMKHSISCYLDSNFIETDCIQEVQKRASRHGWEGVFPYFGIQKSGI